MVVIPNIQYFTARAYISSNVGWFHWFHSHNLELPYIPDFSLSLPTHIKWFHAFLTFWASEAFWEWTNNQELSPTSGLKNVRELNSSVCLQPLKCHVNYEILKYRCVQNGAQNYLRRTQAGPGRAGKHQQEQTSPNLERTILCTSVHMSAQVGKYRNYRDVPSKPYSVSPLIVSPIPVKGCVLDKIPGSALGVGAARLCDLAGVVVAVHRVEGSGEGRDEERLRSRRCRRCGCCCCGG